MNDRDDLEEILRTTYEGQAQTLEQQLDRRLSRLWRTSEQRPERRLLKPALALAGLAVIFVSAWLYDLSQAGGIGPVVLDGSFERPQLVLREPGDPVALTRQAAGRSAAEDLKLLELGPSTGVFRGEATVADSLGNQFLIGESGQIIKRTPQGEESIVLQGLDHPNGLALDRDGNLLVLESGKGRILRVEPDKGQVSLFAEGFATRARADVESRTLMLREAPASAAPRSLSVEPAYLTVNERGEVFVGGLTGEGEAVVYKIGRKSFKWWKFYCLYQC